MKARAGLALAAIVAAIVAVGCGSSGSSSDSVTVQTGSLSKAEFVQKADAICEAARAEFLAKFKTFSNANKAEFADPKQRETAFSEVTESIITPNMEGQVEQISKLGAPSSYAPEVEAFVHAIQERVTEAQDEPLSLISSPYPFKKAENVAKRIGLQGCSESFG